MTTVTEFFAERSIYNCSVRIAAFKLDGNTRRYRAKKQDIIFEDNETAALEEWIELSEQEAQNLLNAIWKTGLRPSKDLLEEHVKPDIKNHLEDMRRLVFDPPLHLRPIAKDKQ